MPVLGRTVLSVAYPVLAYDCGWLLVGGPVICLFKIQRQEAQWYVLVFVLAYYITNFCQSIENGFAWYTTVLA
jgi:hypothetical protein